MFNVIIENAKVESINAGVVMASVKKQNASTNVIIKNIGTDVKVGDYVSLTGTYKSSCGANGELVFEVTPYPGTAEVTGMSNSSRILAYASTVAMQEPKQSANGTVWGDAYYNAPGSTQGVRYRVIFDKSIDTSSLKKGLPIRVFGELSFDTNQYQNKWYCNPKIFVTSMSRGAYPDNHQTANTNPAASASANNPEPMVDVNPSFDEGGEGDFSMYNGGNLF